MVIVEIIKWIGILVTAALAGGFFYALYQSWRFHPRFHLEKEHAKKIFTLRDAVMKERWQSIVKKFSLGTAASIRVAVIEADALADSALKGMDIPGEHLADRLSNLEGEEDFVIKSMQRVWRAHRMRNDLVHTPGFALSPEDAKIALEGYEAFLKELGVI